jgi:hypothetical protein
MHQHDPDTINRLIVEFTDLLERWESNPQAFDWEKLQTLAEKGAHAYNEDAGPSFHALAIDGMQHGEFHERFLAYSVKAGFDPFKLVRPGAGVAAIPVIDHASLAEAAMSIPSSARMRAFLMELAQARFAPLVNDIEAGKPAASCPWYDMMEACAETIPLNLLEKLAPELAKAHHGEKREHAIDPTEGYLTDAEAIIETGTQPYG